jgi:glutathione S-transferase
MTVILYATPLSSYSAKTRIVLLAKGLDFEEREPPGGYRSEEYRRIVPLGTVPALVDGDLVLSESEVIHEYLEECHPSPSLLPGSPAQRARIRLLARFHDLHLEPVVRRMFPLVRRDAGDPAAVAALAEAFEARLAQLVSLATPAPWLAGESLTLADCGHAVSIPLGTLLLEAMGRPVPLPEALEPWARACASHPAVDAALAPWRRATEAWIRARLAA